MKCTEKKRQNVNQDTLFKNKVYKIKSRGHIYMYIYTSRKNRKVKKNNISTKENQELVKLILLRKFQEKTIRVVKLKTQTKRIKIVPFVQCNGTKNRKDILKINLHPLLRTVNKISDLQQREILKFKSGLHLNSMNTQSTYRIS